MRRRHGLLLPWTTLLSGAVGAQTPARVPGGASTVQRGNTLAFPRDHGAHPASRIEWWYATGWLQVAQRRLPLGFQVTFFRSSTGLASDLPGRLAPRHLIFAHAAVSDPQNQRHLHADRAARWAGEDLPDLRTRVALSDADVSMAGWRFQRSGPVSRSLYDTRVQATRFQLQLGLQCALPPLLQGDQGFSRKGPEEKQASHYTSETQARVQGQVQLDQEVMSVQDGRAWIDHEWSDELLHPEAVGWDWIGINLDDGRALMAFQLRRADGSALWTGGSLRAADGSVRILQNGELQWTAGRVWTSPATRAAYPVEWQLQTPVGRWRIRSLLDSQELDSRQSTGTVYWEGLADLLHDDTGQHLGRGYLEMTGYAGRLQL
jgi:predicted secreted hydrolase